MGADVEIDGRDINGNWASREDVVTDSFGQFTLVILGTPAPRGSCIDANDRFEVVGAQLAHGDRLEPRRPWFSKDLVHQMY